MSLKKVLNISLLSYIVLCNATEIIKINYFLYWKWFYKRFI